MKVYWVCSRLGKHFFKTCKDKAQEEIDFRNNDPKKPDLFGEWYIEEEHIKHENECICWNTHEITIKSRDNCSVGMVRKDRSGTRNGIKDDGLCNSCPYLIDEKEMYKIVQSHWGD
jgi:hypothetical protein